MTAPETTSFDLVEEIIACLGDDAVRLRETNPECEMASNMDAAAAELYRLTTLLHNPHTDDFLEATRIEAAHQVERYGDAHDRGKSAENWFWLVGYLAGKCLRAVLTGDKTKALHHTISSAAALMNWHKAITADTTGSGVGHDNDIKPIEIARFEGSDSLDTSEREAVPVVRYEIQSVRHLAGEVLLRAVDGAEVPQAVESGMSVSLEGLA